MALVCLLLAAYLCVFPREIINAVKEGLLLWYNSVLPSVFPFLIITRALIDIGAIDKIGRILEPVMRPVFRIPGCGSFPLIMGGIAGYPVGAKITADLRERGALSRTEAQRLISFCNNPSPVFMLGAVGTSILGSAAAGYLILASNYMSAILVGLIFRFYNAQDEDRTRKSAITYAYRANVPAAPLGKIMRDSVMYAVEVAVQIGGFILLFSALIKILEISRLLTLFSSPIGALEYLGVNESLIEPFAAGIFEITNGISMIGCADAGFPQKVIISGILVSFGGLSIFAQTAGFISKTDISPGIYLFSKVLHGLLQGLVILLLYPYIVGAFAPVL